MKRNYILPSEGLNYIQHDCRLETLKYQSRSSLYDVSLLSSLLAKTKSSVYTFYPSYLNQENEEIKSPKETVTSSSDTDSLNKILKESLLNQNDPAYGNIYWPSSVTCTFNEDIIILDTLGHRLIVFNKELIFKYQIGTYGSEDGKFNEPSDIVLNEIGRLYVADKNNYRIQIFNETKLRTRYQKLSVIKSGNEFTFNKCIYLNDKPIKLASAALSSVVAVSTEKGFIYILNEYNEIINFLKIKKFDFIDLKNILVNENGSEFISVRKNEEEEIYLKFYKIDDRDENVNSNYIKKMSFLRKVKLEKQYLPGVCLTRFNSLKFTLDLKGLLLYDIVNLSLLEFDHHSGKFVRILLKAENHLTNLLNFDFSGNRQHLVSVEAETNKKFSLCSDSTSDLSDENRYKFRSRTYSFKVKVYKYRDCECHRSGNKSRLTLMNRSIGYNPSFNFSLESYSAEFNF
ncbi:unnamed protein product [Brachionus calyciflorus]|uniref:Uncharacterized protein n=1 Tax=Brachionus calyciflorus TaxID=104777 RepID=A0A814A3M5_9BILA|nr:unnamed protein product [Brachionus calyciflorus]